MVVLGGAGTRFGALVGGFFYTLLDYRLRSLAGEERIQDLPDVLRIPLSEPLFLLGRCSSRSSSSFPAGWRACRARIRAARRQAAARAEGDRRVSVRIAWERRGAGSPLVLVHGLGYARWGWEPVVDAARRALRGRSCLDNRGIGESDAPPGPYSAAEIAEDDVVA